MQPHPLVHVHIAPKAFAAPPLVQAYTTMGIPPSFCKLTFYNPLHFSCTIACGCSDPLDDCDVTTGQCPCRPLATGRTCDRCEVNTFGDPNLGCMVSGENCQLCTSLPHGSAERSTMTLAILHVTVHKLHLRSSLALLLQLHWHCGCMQPDVWRVHVCCQRSDMNFNRIQYYLYSQ